jgi:23S rRNA (uracil1939-C5)-methyltransferase
MEFTLEIRDLSRSGAGVGEAPDGRIVFVALTAPGDLVRVKISKEEKRYLEGEVLELIRPSNERIQPRCPAFGRCGGCEWQHLPYELQWKKKVEGIRHGLHRVGVTIPEEVPQDLFPAQKIWNYRNRVQLRAREGLLGFYQRGSKQIVPIEECFIAEDTINKKFSELRRQTELSTVEQKIEVWTTKAGVTDLAFNQRHSAGGFSQVHWEQNEVLCDWVDKQMLGGELLLDLFGGSGNLSEIIHGRYKQTHVVDTGTETARKGTRFFHRAPVFHWLKRFASEDSIDVILDPPREGLGRDLPGFVQELARLKVRKIVWVACEVDPWALGVLKLAEQGWNIKRWGALDFFPQTHHIEALAVLDRDSG